MEAQDATTVFFLKLWPRIEANKNRIIAALIIVAVAIAAIWFFSAQRAQKEISAGEAMTQLTVSQDMQPESFLKIANEYPATQAGQRALLQDAGRLFAQNNFAEAQAQFQKFLDQNPESEFFPQAELGVAACLSAQGKTDLAAGVYQRLMNGPADTTVANMAKFALAEIDEAQGKSDEAMGYYEDVARANQNNSLGADAAWHLMQLKNKMPAAPASKTPAAAPFQMSK